MGSGLGSGRWFVLTPAVLWSAKPDGLLIVARQPGHAFVVSMDFKNTDVYAEGAIDELQMRLFIPMVKGALQEKMAHQVGAFNPAVDVHLGLTNVFQSAGDFISQKAGEAVSALSGTLQWYGTIAGAIWGTWKLVLLTKWLITTALSCFFRFQARGPGLHLCGRLRES